GAEIERDVNLETAISRRVRGDVNHVLDAVDLLLERGNHRRCDHVCARPGILTADPDHWRCDLRKLGDRQPPDGHRANDHEDERTARGKTRPVYEEGGEAHGRLRSPNWRRSEGRLPTPRRCSIAVAKP